MSDPGFEQPPLGVPDDPHTDDPSTPPPGDPGASDATDGPDTINPTAETAPA